MKETNTKSLWHCGVCCIALLLVVCIACGMLGTKLILVNQTADAMEDLPSIRSPGPEPGSS